MISDEDWSARLQHGRRQMLHDNSLDGVDLGIRKFGSEEIHDNSFFVDHMFQMVGDALRDETVRFGACKQAGVVVLDLQHRLNRGANGFIFLGSTGMIGFPLRGLLGVLRCEKALLLAATTEMCGLRSKPRRFARRCKKPKNIFSTI
jgi:hypothetical protein